ncbi:MAG TPA: tetratricopeptide repeat protein, partial [Blastocatellia bacterium]|nr:tetratricopeptide repeat protein [Blastocatellia bacterium]
RGDFDGAIADHTRAIELKPGLAEGYNNRANALYARGDYAAAVADYDRALAINPRYAEVYANRGMLRLRTGRRAEADADFEQGLALKPDMKSSLERRIQVLQSQLSSQYSLTQKGSNDND